MEVGKELTNAVWVAASFLSLIAVAEIWHRHGGSKEGTRKLVHIAGGLICMVFPLLFQSAWTVFILAIVMSGLFLITRRANLLKSLHGVDRRTRGTEYYPIAILLAYLIAAHEPWRYISALGVLAVADGFAGLTGTRYGSIRYHVEDSSKSLEGSLVFLVIAFLTVHLPVLLMTDLSRQVCVLAALYVAILVTGFEAISLSGSDNFFIPLGVCIILDKITSHPLQDILYQLISLACVCLVIGGIAYRSRTFNTGGLIGLILFVYGSWSLGSKWWALPVIIYFLAYMIIWRICPLTPAHGFRVRIVTKALGIPLVILILGNLLRKESTFFPAFWVAIGTVAGIVFWNHGIIFMSRTRSMQPWLMAGLSGTATVVLMLAMIYIGHVPINTDMTVLTAGITMAALICNTWIQRHAVKLTAEALWLRTQIIIVSIAGLLCLVTVEMMTH